MKLQWKTDEYGQLTASVPTYGSGLTGRYDIRITPRPVYCDRGDWLIHVEQEGHAAACSLDHADGFPRYFFGSAEEVEHQMEVWAERRNETKPGESPSTEREQKQ